MRKIILFILIIAFTNFFSQNKKENDYKKLIDSALVIKANDLYRFYKKELQKEEKNENWHIYIENLKKSVNNTYVIDENHLAVNMENLKTIIPLKTLDIESQKNRKLLRKGIDIWKIIPNLKGNTLKISILDASLNYKNKSYEFLFGGSSTIIFQYSCEEERWKLIKEEHKGI